MLLFRASWFYLRLGLADLQFLGWFFWRYYLKTQVMGVATAWLLLAGLLVIKQLSAWNIPSTSLNPSFSSLAENHEIQWYLTTSSQAKALCNQLEQAAALQPTHRDILINLSFCRTAENNVSESTRFWRTATKLEPNSPIFSPKEPLKPKAN
jgi:cytochrome c-type biogenesis protein CcmH/NrfG